MLPLAPLHRAFGVEAVIVTSLQAASGAGYPGVPSLDLIDNVVPYIGGEEEKLQNETAKMLGDWEGGQFRPAPFPVSATCTRVPVRDGHTESVSVRLKTKASADELIAAWREFRGRPQELRSALRAEAPGDRARGAGSPAAEPRPDGGERHGLGRRADPALPDP